MPRFASVLTRVLCLIPVAGAAVAGLPPDPRDWVCEQSPAPVTRARIEAWCEAHPDRGEAVDLGTPATVSRLDDKNAFDFRLRDFLRNRRYAEELNWVSDKTWRLTGPYVGEIGKGKAYGVHPAVRIYYSPGMIDWLCDGREGPIPTGAMLVKEMHPINKELGIKSGDSCLVIDKPASRIKPTSWTVMVRTNAESFDGWYWANPSGSGSGNPPILDKTAVTEEDFFGPAPVKRDPDWYPTGDLFSAGKPADIVSPYSLYGAYCLNCHASAEKFYTYASMDNILSSGILYKHFKADESLDSVMRLFSGGQHLDESAEGNGHDFGFSQPRSEPLPGFKSFYGDLGVDGFSEAIGLRLPAETFDHQLSHPDGPGQFLTSDQCIGCHDATVSNASTPNMLITDERTGEQVNVSPYGEWRASPMGLAGRDPIFFSQLQSETNNLPELDACIENTCLHCHGVMGQRQYAIDTGDEPDNKCKSLFKVAPPREVPFGKPFRLDRVTEYQNGNGHNSQYGNLARDGISCTVCHHVSDKELGEESSFTGNFVTGPADELYGPFKDDTIAPKPMEHALDVTPKYAKQVSDSGLCGSCHNILLPVFDNDGRPHKVATVKGKDLYASYEQTTHLEWLNSDFAKAGDTFRSCQDCHMPGDYNGQSLAGTKIANIESSDFPPTTHRLPDKEITLTGRDNYRRHSLHGLNVFLNEMFQQFPVILGVRQIDYMTPLHSQPALITGNRSMLEMARNETADIEIETLSITADGRLEAGVKVTNKTGHYLPSGVGFRRMFIEFTVEDKKGELLWASGRTNELGAILDGVSENVLPGERGVNNKTRYQKHHQRITRADQVQIYQELIRDSEGYFTTSFMRRAEPVKDNRLRGKGFDPAMFAGNDSPYIQLLARSEGAVKDDPYYTNPDLTGADRLVYSVRLEPGQAERIAKVKARLFSQSIPPFYLQQRFADATKGPAKKSEIQRLYYMTSHLNTGEGTSVENWKLPLVEDCRTAGGKPCRDG